MPTAAVIPELAYPDVRAAGEWLCRVFGFTVRLRIANHRIQLNAGEGALVITQLPPEALVGHAHATMIRVEDVDGHFAHAVAEGAATLSSPVTYPYGERQYSAVDPAGHRWTFSQSVEDIDPASWGGMPEQL